MQSSTQIRSTTTVSPEGRPARPKASPHLLVLRIVVFIVGVIAIAAGVGLVFGLPGAIIAAMLVAAAAVIFNPELWSTKQRVEDLAEADGERAS